MADEQQETLLHTGVQAWNEWRQNRVEDPNAATPDLRKSRLHRKDLTGVDFSHVNLDDSLLDQATLIGGNLRGADLNRARLNNTKLDGSDLEEAVFENASLSSASLKGANLEHANLKFANLSLAILDKACLSRAYIQYANLYGAFLEGADLENAGLQHANLSNAQLKGANLTNANLSDADLRTASGVLLDSTFTRNARFASNASDPWSVLRRTYTGSRLAFNILFLLAFIIPYVSKTIFWTAMNRSQELDTAMSEVATKCLAASCEAHRVWKILLGLDKGPMFVLLAILLLSYNLIKAFLTYVVAPMRDEEERSGYSPSWTGNKWWRGYRPLYYLHRIVGILFYVSIAALLFNAWYWMSQIVWIPARE